MIRVRRGDLCTIPAEGVIRPVSSVGEPVTTVSRRVETAAGPTVVSRIESLGELPLGGAVITPAGELAAMFVIHVVVQSAEEPVSRVNMHRALVNGLRRAAEWGVESLSVPPVGLGPGTVEPEDAARILVDVLREHLRLGPLPREITIVVESDYEEDLYMRLVATTERANGGE